jgi:exosortase
LRQSLNNRSKKQKTTELSVCSTVYFIDTLFRVRRHVTVQAELLVVSTNKPVQGTPTPNTPSDQSRLLAFAICFVLALLGAYWPIWSKLASTWMKNAQYSHGVFVIPFAAFLLWHRRELRPTDRIHPTWWAIPFLILAGVLRLAGGRYYVITLEQYSIFPAVIGLILALMGWRGLRWALPSIAFLFFMIPLHGRVAGLLTGPLQRIATQSSTFLLQTAGIPAVSTGNVIHLTGVDIGVVEACNGLRMMMTFFALTVAVAVIVDRVWWQKLFIAASAIPIALGANIIRISSTCYLHETGAHEFAQHVFHDLAGWLMMPFALGALWVMLFVLDKVFVPILDETDIGQSPGKQATVPVESLALPNRVTTIPPSALQATGK